MDMALCLWNENENIDPAPSDAPAAESFCRDGAENQSQAGAQSGDYLHQRRRRAQRAAQTPEEILDRHIDNLDPNRIFSIPGASSSQPNAEENFPLSQIQNCGLLNDGNVCSLISLFLCFHRIQIKEHLIDPHFCFTINRTPDFPTLMFGKILKAMPSQNAFSLQLFIESWNQAGKDPTIHPGFNDIPSLAEALITNLQLKQYASRSPAISQFLGSFNCRRCGKEHVKVKNWELQIQAAIPLLQLPPGNQPANIFELFASYLEEPFETRCSNQECRNRIFNAKLETEAGVATVLAVNRFDENDRTRKRMNKLQLLRNESNMAGQNLLGELVSVVCHRGDVNHGHFVSYCVVADQWYLNDDSRSCVPSVNPMDQQINESETVDLLFFKS